MKLHECPRKESGCFQLGRCVLKDEHIDEAVRVLSEGGVIAFPTDTLYALAADPYNTDAVNKVFRLKNRSFDLPLAIAVYDADAMRRLAEVGERAERIISRFLPGPITVILKTKENFPRGILMDGKVAFRIPRHPLPREIIRRFGPVTITSSNIHGRGEPVDAVEVIDQLGDGLDILIDCGRCHHGAPSTVVDISGDELKIIREGVIRAEDLQSIW